MGKHKAKTAKQKQIKRDTKKLTKAFAKQLHVGLPDVVMSENKKTKHKHRRRHKKLEKGGDNEQSEFRRQQAALMERMQVVKKRRAKAKPAAVLTFQPPTFVLNDAEKPTQQLVYEATNQVQSLGVNNTASRFMMSLPQQQQQFNPQAAPVDESHAYQKKNSWALLDDTGENTTQPTTASFQFAPASFSVGDHEIDPDL